MKKYGGHFVIAKTVLRVRLPLDATALTAIPHSVDIHCYLTTYNGHLDS